MGVPSAIAMNLVEGLTGSPWLRGWMRFPERRLVSFFNGWVIDHYA
jgi:hypothetical protein